MKAFVRKILAVSLAISMILSNGLVITAADLENEQQQESINTTAEFVYEFTDMQVI